MHAHGLTGMGLEGRWAFNSKQKLETSKFLSRTITTHPRVCHIFVAVPAILSTEFGPSSIQECGVHTRQHGTIGDVMAPYVTSVGRHGIFSSLPILYRDILP